MNSVRLNTMIKKAFNSELFKRSIKPDEKDFISFVKAELLYRIDYLKYENCSCSICNNQLKEYSDYYDKLKQNDLRYRKLDSNNHFS